MKVLVLTKRQYMGKDFIDDRFGRFRELPLEVAKLGHEVNGACVSYQFRQEGLLTDVSDDSSAHVSWRSFNLGRLIIPGLLRYLHEAKRLTHELKPDLIWACSDSFHAVFGVWLANLCRTKCVVDLYDHFEAFPATRLTGVLPLFKRAVKSADGVTCFSKRLADRITQNYQCRGPVTVVENGVRMNLFYPRKQIACRQRLGLPTTAKIIGTAGALYSNRGIGALFRGFELLAAEMADLHLAIAGPREHNLRIPNGPHVHDFGILPWEEVPFLVGALDVGVICYQDSLIGRYSFPQKAYEIMACKIPLVAAAIGTMEDLLARNPECLFKPGDPHSFVKAVRLQLTNPTLLDSEVPSWTDSSKRLETFFAKIIRTVR